MRKPFHSQKILLPRILVKWRCKFVVKYLTAGLVTIVFGVIESKLWSLIFNDTNNHNDNHNDNSMTHAAVTQHTVLPI